MPVANFFWHGAPLSLYERACISSFVSAGFSVRLHSFDARINAPTGVQICPAQKYADVSEVRAYSQGGIVGSIAAFSDIFRYRVLSDGAGWWFDTDVFCLRNAEEFARLEAGQSALVGREDRVLINGAVFYCGDSEIAKALGARAKALGFEFRWGDAGPRLITSFAKESGGVRILDSSAFYPIHYRDADMLFDPAERQSCEVRMSNSYCIHLWNEYFRRWRLPKGLAPCSESVLAALFERVAEGEPLRDSLPYESFAALRAYGEMRAVSRLLSRWEARLVAFKQGVFR